MATSKELLEIRGKGHRLHIPRWRTFWIACKIAVLGANISHTTPSVLFFRKILSVMVLSDNACHLQSRWHRFEPSTYKPVVKSVCLFLCSVQWLSTAIDWTGTTDALLYPLLCDTFLLALDDSNAHTLQWSKGAVNRCKSIQLVEVSRKPIQLTFSQFVVLLF